MAEQGATFQLSGSKKATPSTPGRPKTILRAKSFALNVYHNGKILTPKPLNPEVYHLARERQIGVYDDSSTCSWKEPSSIAPVVSYNNTPQSTLRFKTEIAETTMQGSVFIGGSVDVFDASIPSELQAGTPDESGSELVAASESFDSLAQVTMHEAAPTHVSLVLSETETTFVLDIPSCTALKDTEEGEEAARKNQEYEYITEGKGRNRKVVNAEVQTVRILKKSRDTEAEPIKYHNRKAFASNWEMYDTYHEKQEEAEVLSSSSSDSEYDGTASESSSLDSYRMASDEKQLYKLMKNVRFQEAVCVIERLLANNYYNEAQKRFRGLSDPNCFREDIQYKYRLNLLWTFANSETKGRCVSAIHWNPANQDLVAVGYGKFYFAETSTGMVMIWNIKNPDQPERTYYFEDPVTTLSFSTKDPNLLAVGFYSGQVIVYNISSREPNLVGRNIPSFEAIWCVVWRPNLDLSKGTEQICASSDDGRVIFYTIETTEVLQAQQMMRVAKADGKLKGYNSMRKCSSLNIPVSRYAGARFIRWHPDDLNIYLVGTNEGVVHKCSTNYLNQHLDLFLAHDGPINDLQYSPFSKKIYATCGDDWHLRIWAEGISEPLHELFVTMRSVQAMDWSPTHSTILATIYGNTILLWDFQRKVWKPQSETQSPTGSRNTIVQFIKSGRCLVVGDIEGNVHVFSLEDMPFPAFFQENLLFESLERSLTTNLKLMEKFKKLRRTTLENSDVA